MPQQNPLLTTRIDEINEVRRQFGMILSFILIISISVSAIYSRLTGVTMRGTSPDAFDITLLIVCVVTFFMLRRQVFIRVILHVPILILLAVFIVIPTDIMFSVVVISSLVWSAIILPWQSYLFSLVVMSGVTLFLQQQSTSGFPFIPLQLLSIVLSGLIYYVVYRFEYITRSVHRVNRLLQVSSTVGQSINNHLELQQLLDSTVRVIRDEFGFYHVQVFLIDDNRDYLNLAASTGEIGQQLLRDHHRLPADSLSMIGHASQVGEMMVVQRISEVDIPYQLNKLLPHTSAELAIPLMTPDMIGVLDVQSLYTDTFQPNDIQALQIIANQLAIAIRNVRLFEEAQRHIQENRKLLSEYQKSMQDLERLNYGLTQQSWERYLGQSYIDGVTIDDDQLVEQAQWSVHMRDATQSQESIIQSAGDTHTVAVPIILRGQTLGAIELELDEQMDTHDAVEISKVVSERLAMSLESARLFEEIQDTSLQEQQINDIVSSYETAMTVDELLQITLTKLQQSLGADSGSIRLGGAITSKQVVENEGTSA